MTPSSRTWQEFRTTLDSDDVLSQAKRFFSQRNPLYATFLEREGPTHAIFRGQGGEELVIGTSSIVGGTLVTGSSYLFDMQVARFFSTLPPRGVVRGGLMSAFVSQLRARPVTIEVGAADASAITIRVEMPEVWDAVRITAPSGEPVVAIKQRALEALFPSAQYHEDFVIKLRGHEILNEHKRRWPRLA